MPVRNIMFVGASLASAGCSDPGSLCNQPAILAGMPVSDVETLNRVCGAPRGDVVPAAAESGDVWPPAPEHVPTSLELLRQTPEAERAAGSSQTVRHARGYGLCRPVPHAPGAVAARTSAVAPGVALGLCYDPLIHGSTAGSTGPG